MKKLFSEWCVIQCLVLWVPVSFFYRLYEKCRFWWQSGKHYEKAFWRYISYHYHYIILILWLLLVPIYVSILYRVFAGDDGPFSLSGTFPSLAVRIRKFLKSLCTILFALHKCQYRQHMSASFGLFSCRYPFRIQFSIFVVVKNRNYTLLEVASALKTVSPKMRDSFLPISTLLK